MEPRPPLKTGLHHWIFDAFDVDDRFTTDKELADKALRDLAEICGMTIVSGPHMVEGIPENPGMTGVCVVDFSHIAIHTFSNPKEVCVDIFSCKPYDARRVHEYLLKTFGSDIEHSIFCDVKYPFEFKHNKHLPHQDAISLPSNLAAHV